MNTFDGSLPLKLRIMDKPTPLNLFTIPILFHESRGTVKLYQYLSD